jgi:hypothetical protein
MHFLQRFTVTPQTYHALLRCVGASAPRGPEAVARQWVSAIEAVTPTRFGPNCEAIIALQFEDGIEKRCLAFGDRGRVVEAWVAHEILPVLQQEDPASTGGYTCGDVIVRF